MRCGFAIPSLRATCRWRVHVLILHASALRRMSKDFVVRNREASIMFHHAVVRWASSAVAKNAASAPEKNSSPCTWSYRGSRCNRA